MMGKTIGFLLVFLLLLSAYFMGPNEQDIDKQIPEEIIKKFAEDMQVSPEGIKYRVVRRGTGRNPQLTNKVMVNYRGFFLDGRVFDSSYKLKKPAVFQVNAVIPGWTRTLMMMKEGGLWEIILPPELAYGAAGAGMMIPPDATLCFQIEFIKIY